jgi:nucleoside-diphosphate-sugar epimerase
LEAPIVLVGGAGYVGTVLTRRLLQRRLPVMVTDNLIYGHGAAIASYAEHPRFSFARIDLRDSSAMVEVLSGARAVVILAGLVGDPITRKYPELSTSINLHGITALLSGCEAAGVRRLVFVSTCSNYGMRSDDEPAREEDPLNPLSLYAKHKVEVEQQLLARRDGATCPVVLRVATAFGISPRMRFDLSISEFTRELAMGRELSVFDLDTWRPYCHVEDIAAAIELTLDSDERVVRGEVFNVGSDANNYTKRMLVDEVVKAVGGGKVVCKVGGTDARNYRVNFAKISETLCFRARYSVADSIATLVGAVRSGFYDDVDERKSFYGNYTIDSPFTP